MPIQVDDIDRGLTKAQLESIGVRIPCAKSTISPVASARNPGERKMTVTDVLCHTDHCRFPECRFKKISAI